MRILYPIVFALLLAGCGHDSTTAPSATVTDTFASVLSVRGSSAREFILLKAGTVTVSIDAMNPVYVVGLGLGSPDATKAGCSTTMTIETAGGTTDELSTTLNPGTYCVKVYDVGNLTQATSFTISIVHP